MRKLISIAVGPPLIAGAVILAVSNLHAAVQAKPVSAKAVDCCPADCCPSASTSAKASPAAGADCCDGGSCCQ